MGKKQIHSTTLEDLRVLEALTEDNFAPRTTAEVAEKVKRSNELTYASLVTLQAAEYVKKHGSRWELTARLAMFAKEVVARG